MYVCSHNQEVVVYVATHCEGALETILVNCLSVDPYTPHFPKCVKVTHILLLHTPNRLYSYNTPY